ncbi:MAG TPA: hypothetical protein VGF71_14760 [Caulobacteraceae bacterium]|jgi:hypothetical protein
MQLDDVVTERVPTRCIVKEGPKGEPYLSFEARDFDSLPNVHFGIELAPETSLGQAKALAEVINILSPNIFALIFSHPPLRFCDLPKVKPARDRARRAWRMD